MFDPISPTADRYFICSTRFHAERISRWIFDTKTHRYFPVTETQWHMIDNRRATPVGLGIAGYSEIQREED